MPANLPPQYYEAERRYKEAKTYEEKISILQELLAIMPKHKGTDKLQADLRARISRLKKEKEKKRGPHRRSSPYRIPREGVAQVILIGTPNTGKSSILSALTKATPQIAPYPFTTREPVVGMMVYENIKIQLVDTPPISRDFIAPWLGDILRRADLLTIVVDLGREDILDQIDDVLLKLHELKIKPDKEGENDEEENFTYKRMIVLANKEDLERAKERFSILEEFYKDKFPIILTSIKNIDKMDKVKKQIYQFLDIIRVYTKVPGQPPDMDDPIVLKRGSLVVDAARSIHKDFAANLKYARIWGTNKFKGQKVEREHVLEEGDILEFHI